MTEKTTRFHTGTCVALALHHRSNADSTARRPNDLDVVVSPSGMDRLSDLDYLGLSQLGFKSEPGNTESLSWAGQGRESLVVDVVPAKNSIAGRGFERRQMHGGVNVIPLQALVDNLTYRVRSEPANQQARSDLARGLELLDAAKGVA